MIKKQRKFEQLAFQQKDRIYGFCCYFLGNHADASDVTQEVLIKLWKHGQEIEEAILPAWVSRVTRNACIDFTRRQQTQNKYVSHERDAYPTEYKDERLLLPDEQVEKQEFNAQVQRAIKKIDEPYRSIVVMRELQAHKYEEIAETLSLPLNTVKVYLHRARKQLRTELKKILGYSYAKESM